MSETRIHKLTGEPVSQEFLNVVERLGKCEDVSQSEIKALKEIIFADACISKSTPTIDLKGREIIQENVFERLQKMGSAVTQEDGTVTLTGEVRCEKRLDIIIGLPAAGKSSAIAEPISELFKSRIIDCDEAKKMLPGYDGGWGAQAVHDESKTISDRQLETALKKGENITYPRVGAGYEVMESVINKAKKAGYKVYVHYNEVNRNIALGRMLDRFIDTGRYLQPELITGNGNKISETYEKLTNSGLLDGYSKWDNGVEFGKRPDPKGYSPSWRDVYEALIKEKPGAIKDKIEQHDTVVEKLTEEIEALKSELRDVKAKLATAQKAVRKANYAFAHISETARSEINRALGIPNKQNNPALGGNKNSRKPPGSLGSPGKRR